MNNNKYALVGVFSLVVVVVFVWFHFGNSNSFDRYRVGQQSVPVCPDCNVIIVGLDALQAAHVSHLGYMRKTTPTLDMFAGQGTSFGNAISSASWTVPSFMSIMTGLYPSEHKVVNKFTVFNKDEQVVTNLAKLSPQVETIAQVFKKNGYITGGFTGDAGVGAQFGYNQGFDVYTDEKTFGSIENSSDHALKWLAENPGKKFFMFLHGYDNHGQFDLPENYQGEFMTGDYHGFYKGTKDEQRILREKGLADGHIDLTPEDVAFWRSWYDSKIKDTDARFAKFWEDFNKLGIKNKTIVVFVSDHGTEFYEHQRFDHGFSLYDEVVHVPLVFVVPGLEGKGIVSDQVTTLDLAPTIIDLTGIDPGSEYLSQLRGKSLLPYLMTGKGKSDDNVFMETDYREYTHKRGVRTADGWKYILTLENGNEELYNLKEDPSESKNLVEEEVGKKTELKNEVLQYMQRTGQDINGPWKIGCLPVYGDQCK